MARILLCEFYTPFGRCEGEISSGRNMAIDRNSGTADSTAVQSGLCLYFCSESNANDDRGEDDTNKWRNL